MFTLFSRVVLGKTKSISDMGNMQWEIFDCFVLAWILVYVCVFKGIKSAGKVSTATSSVFDEMLEPAKFIRFCL